MNCHLVKDMVELVLARRTRDQVLCREIPLSLGQYGPIGLGSPAVQALGGVGEVSRFRDAASASWFQKGCSPKTEERGRRITSIICANFNNQRIREKNKAVPYAGGLGAISRGGRAERGISRLVSADPRRSTLNGTDAARITSDHAVRRAMLFRSGANSSFSRSMVQSRSNVVAPIP